MTTMKTMTEWLGKYFPNGEAGTLGGVKNF